MGVVVGNVDSYGAHLVGDASLENSKLMLLVFFAELDVDVDPLLLSCILGTVDHRFEERI
jgi:hypothetical protein